ncbi:porin [Sphingobium sp. WCS2017Hpa-17]|uniref:OprO/OprP family phosphate-selective porin n=1 Tax=Sphingobium sp. WCS2017Hpa-17 TaxID=3073638 RepID=UPI00288C00FD|nr:porin [Sphingobium sp. WCS2017Hpa-17]
MTSLMLRGNCAALALIAATPALAQTPSADELAALVKAQAAEIASLKARLDKIEGQAMAPAAAPAPAPQVAQQTQTPPVTVAPFAPQIVPPGPADIDVAQARAIAKEVGVKTEWGAGLPVFRSADGVFTYKPRGRILVDVSSTMGSKYNGRNTTTTGMRALRLGLEGGVGPHFFYQFESDFSENEVDIVTAFLGYRNKISSKVDYDVRAGHLFNDRAFEGSTGSDSTPFLERSAVSTAIIPQRGFYGIGIMGRMFGPNWHASVSVTGDRVDGQQATNDSRTAAFRAHWNPIKTDRSLLHLGAWGFDEALSSAATTLTRSTVIGGRFNGAVRVSTGELLGGKSTTGYGVELGGYTGGLWVMGEAGRRVARLTGGRPDFESKAWSLSTGLFLTGELPPYNPRLGSFGQPNVIDPVLDGGSGAIELTARYENLDYTDLVLGGDGWAATVGVNWYLNSFTRIQLNGIHWHTDNRAGSFTGNDDGQTVSARVGVTF